MVSVRGEEEEEEEERGEGMGWGRESVRVWDRGEMKPRLEEGMGCVKRENVSGACVSEGGGRWGCELRTFFWVGDFFAEDFGKGCWIHGGRGERLWVGGAFRC